MNKKIRIWHPKHLTMIPFSRNVVGPMDFTPVCFGEIRGKQRRTSNGFEIALSVILQSGISHFVEIPQSMAKQPDFVIDFMKNVPHSWDDIRLLEGFPGKYTVIARKSDDKWYIGGINSQSEPITLNIDLTQLKRKQPIKSVTIITDGNINRDFIQKEEVLDNNKLKITIRPSGGFVCVY
ncbi:MAG: glycoside hydrolase family 97 C-terminal domain-containing protein [Paludibacteraceae bacterium]